MTSEQQLRLALRLAIVLFVVGVLSYAAFSSPAPHEPVRLMFQTSAGKVVFGHKTHSDIAGYAISCGDCHHTLAEGEYADAQSCSECHEIDYGDEDVPKRSDAFHQQCIGCHVDFEKGPGDTSEDCAACHVM